MSKILSLYLDIYVFHLCTNEKENSYESYIHYTYMYVQLRSPLCARLQFDRTYTLGKAVGDVRRRSSLCCYHHELTNQCSMWCFVALLNKDGR